MPNVRVLATDLEFPEGPVAMPDGSVVLVEIRGQTADAGLARRTQGGGGRNSRRSQWRRDRSGRQMLHLQQWRLRLDPIARHHDARPAQQAEYIGGSIQRIDLLTARSKPCSTNAASIR